MNDLLLSLALGAALVAAANLLLYCFSRWGGLRVALLVAALTVAVYVPLALRDWPGGDVFAIHLALYLVVSCLFGVIAGARDRALVLARSADRGGRTFVLGPAAIIGFFVVLVAVDSVFVMVAQNGLSSGLARRLLPHPVDESAASSAFPGVVSHDFQKKEALYNAYLERVERQRERGWQVHKGWLGEPAAGREMDFQVVVRDRDGRPISGAEVGGEFLRPSDERLDTRFEMHEGDAGVYRARIALPAPGMWNLVLVVRKGEDMHEVRANTSVAARE